MTRINSFLFTGMLVVLLLACDSSRIFQDYNDLEEAFWHVDSVQRFEFAIEEVESTYNIQATFRNAVEYPYYNLYFQYVLLDSLDTLDKQLREIDFFDAKTGEPYGDGLGNLFDHQMTLLEEVQFEKPGKYVLELQQFMRLDTLPLILSVGARVERVVVD